MSLGRAQVHLCRRSSRGRRVIAIFNHHRERERERGGGGGGRKNTFLDWTCLSKVAWSRDSVSILRQGLLQGSDHLASKLGAHGKMMGGRGEGHGSGMIHCTGAAGAAGSGSDGCRRI